MQISGRQAGQNQPAVKLQLASRPPKIEVHSQPAKVEIANRSGVLEINAKDSRASYGIYTVAEFSRRAARQAKQRTLAAIGTIAAEGDRLMRIETGENVVPAIAAEHNAEPVPEITWGYVTRPSIRYTPQPVSYQVQPHQVDIKVESGVVENLTPPAMSGWIDVMA